MIRMPTFPVPSIVSAASRWGSGRWQRLLEILLLALLAFQCAGLFWALVTPLGPIGAWEPRLARPAGPAVAILGETDPFLTGGRGSGPAVVTSLDLTLHGVRQGGGRSSAIIATPDGKQRSFVVGDEIVPGVRLSGVAFDHVSLSRGGATEQLYMDQSGPAEVVGGAGGDRAPASSSPPAGAKQ